MNTIAESADPPKGLDGAEVCGLTPEPPPVLPDLGGDHLRAIIDGRAIWVNGTVLRYYFFDGASDGSYLTRSDGTQQWVSWVGAEDQRAVVRAAFAEWDALGIGLDFREVEDRSEAELRIGFQQGAGSWVTRLGRLVLSEAATQRTMNFGWDLRAPYGRTTALHEIGHALGMPHEHQNPFSGIEWDVDEVVAYLGGPPNNWDRATIDYNVLRKLSPSEVRGSVWDPDSVMQYAFPPGLILKPERYRTQALQPPGTLSPLDRQWILQWYPPMAPQDPPKLVPFVSHSLMLAPRQQADFLVEPPATRRYRIGTFGQNDVVLTMFEEIGGGPRFLAGDDDSGEDRNALIDVKLFQGRRYVVRVRMYYPSASGQTAVMYW